MPGVVRGDELHIAVFGLGYVGTTTAACFAARGHSVVGVDIKAWKGEALKQGLSPVREPGLERLLEQPEVRRNLTATQDALEAVSSSAMSLVCVGTPSRPGGTTDLTALKRVARQIGTAMRNTSGYHIVVVRSSVAPGTTQDIVLPLLEQASRKKAGAGFGLCMNPEFLREGSMVQDFMEPQVIVIGQLDHPSGETLKGLYSGIPGKVVQTDLKTAEMVKYANNAFHATKVSFANEIGNICQGFGIDGPLVMQVLCQDQKLNLSPYYLKPGFAFGGSCLTKDLKALIAYSSRRSYRPRLLKSVLKTNEEQLLKALAIAKDMLGGNPRSKRIAMLGVAFKKGTDDIRDSAYVKLVELLLREGAQVAIHDPMAMEQVKARFDSRVTYSHGLEESLLDADLCVLGLDYEAYHELPAHLSLMRSRQVLDLCNAEPLRRSLAAPGSHARYRSICL